LEALRVQDAQEADQKFSEGGEGSAVMPSVTSSHTRWLPVTPFTVNLMVFFEQAWHTTWPQRRQ
jgi:hypothetical protein